MSESAFDLFDEFAVRQARGESPDPVEYLDRAGDGEPDLAELLDLFLGWAPAPSADPTAVLMMNAWLSGDAPLVALRVERGLRVDDVVDSLAGEIDVPEAKRSKLRRYVQRFEQGFVDPSRVDRRVLMVVSSCFETTLENLLTWASAPSIGAGQPEVLFRADTPSYRPSPVRSRGVDAHIDEWDDIDELFLGPRGA